MFRKSIGFLLLFAALATTSNAQFSKGMRMTGGTLASGFFNSGKYDYSFPAPTAGYTSDADAIGLSLAPNLGWFVSDNLVVGARLSIGYDYGQNIDAMNNVTFRKKIDTKFRVGLGGFARNYFKSSGSFIPFGQFHFDAGIGSSTTEGYNYTTTYKDTYDGKSSGDFYADAGLSFGATKMLSPHVGLDLFAGYAYFYSKNKFKTTTQRDVDLNGSIDETRTDNPTTKLTNHGFSFGVGFQVFLGKRK